MSEKLNRTRSSVQNKCNKLGLKTKSKYYYNQDYFENIDTEDKAYWLGFIFADGYISVNPETRNWELGIELSTKDKKHLQKFNKSLNENIAIKDTVRDKTNDDFIKANFTYASRIRIYSKKMTTDLIKLGISNCKTYHEFGLPSIEKKLIIPFIRGFFDGDGCVGLEKNRSCLRCDFCSVNLQFLNEIRDFLFQNYNIKSYISTEGKKYKSTIPCYRLYIRGLNNSYNFCKLLYDNSQIFLDRKKDKYEKIVNDYNILERIS